jgi:alternate signal-mediated exported protein
MAKIKNKKVLAALAATLTVALCAASTFAWMTATDSKDNKLATNIQNAQVVINEVFDTTPNGPPQNLIPGSDVTKQVTVTNTGNSPMLVRVSFQELLTMLSSSTLVATAAPAATANLAPYQSNGFDPTATTNDNGDNLVSAPIKTMMNTSASALTLVDGTTPLAKGALVATTDPAAYSTANGWSVLDPTKVTVTYDTATAPTGLTIYYKTSSTLTNNPDGTTTTVNSTTYAAVYDTGTKDANGNEIYQMVKLGDSSSSMYTIYNDDAVIDTTTNTVTTSPTIASVNIAGVGGSYDTTKLDPSTATAADATAAATKGNVEYMWYNGVSSTDNTWGNDPTAPSTTDINNPLTLETAAQTSPAIGTTWAGAGTITAVMDTDLNYVDVTSSLNANLILKMPVADLEGTAGTTAGSAYTFATSPTPDTAKWYYDATTGYFYWMQPLAGGTSTSELLDSFMLSTAADGTFADMNYDLDVYMQSVQNSKAALGSASGNGVAWVVTDPAVLSALQGMCAN